MGGTLYSMNDRSARAVKLNYFASKSFADVSEQTRKREMHPEMNPKNVKLREARDSDVHPNSTPIRFDLDVTGSMGNIPHMMIKEGLPTLMGTLTQNGVRDAALCFGAIGDHECDHFPLQIGQFESGDAELDMWLTRTCLEGGGGGNAGESYALSWYFAANHCVTDSWEKRQRKGFSFTVGDEPFLENYPLNALKGIMGDAAVAQGTLTAEQLLKAAQEKWHVFHIHVNHGRACDPRWKELLGQHLIEVTDYTTIPRVISDIIIANSAYDLSEQVLGTTGAVADSKKDEALIL